MLLLERARDEYRVDMLWSHFDKAFQSGPAVPASSRPPASSSPFAASLNATAASLNEIPAV